MERSANGQPVEPAGNFAPDIMSVHLMEDPLSAPTAELVRAD